MSSERTNDVAVSVRGLNKSYTIAHQAAKHSTFAEALLHRARHPFRREERETFEALKDVSFDIRKGEVVGIIGRNGAGKSTLLKILSRITEPTSGEIDLYGRVGSLLEVGTGFHPELTGRENIFLNGAILGMSRAEIRKQFDAIVDFSGVEQFLDTPVKRYSSGMYVRLAFAVAAHLESEILIVDEVLAVGDAEFQRRCLGKMRDVASSGRTVLFVSHNMAAVRQLCSNVLVLQGGKLLFLGTTHKAISVYVDATSISNATGWERVPTKRPASALHFTKIDISLQGSQPNHRLLLRCQLHSSAAHPSAFVAIDILDASGTPIAQALPTLKPFIECSPPDKEINLEVDLPPLIPGSYSVTLWTGSHNTDTLDQVQSCVSFDIAQSPTTGRTFPHTLDHGCIVPNSRLLGSEPSAPYSNPVLDTAHAYM